MTYQKQENTTIITGYVHILTLARSRSGSLSNAKTRPELKEQGRRQAFRHDIGELVRGRYVQHTYLAKSDLFSDEVNIQLNMLRAMMMNWIGRHVNRTDVVVEDDSAGGDRLVELLE
jgi:hypothetical protein